MHIYKDLFSGDELCSDTLNPKDCGIVLEVAGKFIDLNAENDFDIGANPSAEETAEELEGETQRVINVVHFHSLVETAYANKAGFIAHIKAYMARVKAHLEENNPERVEEFTKQAQEYVKSTILPNFKDYSFYLGESSDMEAMSILCRWSEDGMTPIFYMWKDGLKEEKV